MNSQTFEHIVLTGQTQFGFDNEGQSISIRGLTSDNAVPALRSYGALCLLEAKLTGRGGASELPAIINYNQGRIFLRDIVTVGYGRALGDVTTPDYVAAYRIRGPDKAGSAGPTVAEYSSHPVTSPFPSKLTSLRLPILETPDAPRDDPASWATVDDFGADPTAQQDSSKAIQQAMDSGASTIFFPGHYALASTVLVRGNVRRILGIGGQVDYAKKVSPDFRVLAGASDVVTFEHFANVGGGIENTTNRTLVLRSIGSQVFSRGTGTLFLEDVAGHELSVKNQTVFARQLNIENEGTHLLNDGGSVWILGYKTERGGCLIDTQRGGSTEVFGTFSYTTTQGKLAPMFINDNSTVFACFQEVCYNGDPFQVLIRETRGPATKVIQAGEGSIWPYSGAPRAR